MSRYINYGEARNILKSFCYSSVFPIVPEVPFFIIDLMYNEALHSICCWYRSESH